MLATLMGTTSPHISIAFCRFCVRVIQMFQIHVQSVVTHTNLPQFRLLPFPGRFFHRNGHVDVPSITDLNNKMIARNKAGRRGKAMAVQHSNKLWHARHIDDQCFVLLAPAQTTIGFIVVSISRSPVFHILFMLQIVEYLSDYFATEFLASTR